MAAGGPRKHLALDTNLLLDLAEEEDWAHEFRERFQAAGYSLFASPTIFEELAFASLYESERKQRLARTATAEARKWGIGVFELNSLQKAIAHRFVQRLIQSRLIPEQEWNDGQILAETSLGNIPILVTSDAHLLNIDTEMLLLQFSEADLVPVHVAHPRALIRAIR